MSKTEQSKKPKILRLAAVFGQLLALFPLSVLFCGAGLGGYIPWVYCAVYAVWGAFYAAGTLCGMLAHGAELKRPRRVLSAATFLSRAAVIVPAAAFAAVVVRAELNSAALFYVLPGGVIAFFGAHGGVSRGYSDVFSRGWFGLYFALAIFTCAMLWSSREEALLSAGVFRLSAGFAVMILLSALLANQTNIDLCTKQRAGGRAVLPSGLRLYNALLITVVCSAATGLFLFAKPLGQLITLLVSLITRGALFVMKTLGSCVQPLPDDGVPGGDPTGVSDPFSPEKPGAFASIGFALLTIGLIIVLFLLRRQIAELLKSVFEPLFRLGRHASDVPFYDEISVSDAKALTPRARRRAEHELARRYGRESDPALKYRLGYALFLVRLGKTDKPPVPADTTAVHREKGESAFGRDLGELSGVYDRVRYGEAAPTAEELSRQAELLAEIR